MNKASELVKRVYAAEDAISKKICDVITQEINSLTKDTGLIIDDISMGFIDVSSVEDDRRIYAATRVTISHRLPVPLYRS